VGIDPDEQGAMNAQGCRKGVPGEDRAGTRRIGPPASQFHPSPLKPGRRRGGTSASGLGLGQRHAGWPARSAQLVFERPGLEGDRPFPSTPRWLPEFVALRQRPAGEGLVRAADGSRIRKKVAGNP